MMTGRCSFIGSKFDITSFSNLIWAAQETSSILQFFRTGTAGPRRAMVAANTSWTPAGGTPDCNEKISIGCPSSSAHVAAVGRGLGLDDIIILDDVHHKVAPGSVEFQCIFHWNLNHYQVFPFTFSGRKSRSHFAPNYVCPHFLLTRHSAYAF